MKKIFELDVSSPTSTSPQWIEKQGKLQTNRMNHACMVFNEAIFISGGNLHIGGTPSYAEIDSVERFEMFECLKGINKSKSCLDKISTKV